MKYPDLPIDKNYSEGAAITSDLNRSERFGEVLPPAPTIRRRFVSQWPAELRLLPGAQTSIPAVGDIALRRSVPICHPQTTGD